MKRGKSKMRQSKRKRIVFIVTVISIIVVLGIVGLFKSGAMIQKDYKKPVRYKKLKYLSYKLEDHYNKKILCSSGIKEMPYEYQIKKNGKLYGTLIDEYGYPLKKYGHVMEDTIAYNVKHISFGGRGSLLYLDHKNRLYGMGWNSHEEFQIKMPEDKRNNVSTAVFRQPVFIMKNIIYASINEGGAVIAMKKDRSVWTWGSNAGGMLGYDKNTDLISCKPKKIFENVKYIAAGGYNMAVITEKNNLYLWGDNTYGQLGNGKKDGWYFGDSNKECWFKPKKVMGDVAAVHIGSGKIIVTRMDGSKWATGIGFGNERSESEKKVGTRFVMISK